MGTIYINEAKAAMESGAITLKQYELLAVAINTGTNLPSVATPNGQAAFLFLLTSALAPLIRLSYSRMVWMALPYTLVLTLVGLLCVEFTLAPCNRMVYANGLDSNALITTYRAYKCPVCPFRPIIVQLRPIFAASWWRSE